MAFSGPKIGLVRNTLHSIVDNHTITKYLIVIFNDNNAYQKVQLSEKIFAASAGNKLASFNITNKLLEGADTSTNHW